MTDAADFPPPVGVSVTFVGDDVTLAVRGRLDALTSPELAEVMNVMIDAGHLRLTLDLAGQDAVSDSGVRAILEGASRLSLSGGALTLRAPSPSLCRLLDAVGATGMLRVERTEPVSELAGPSSDPFADLAGPASRDRYADAVVAGTADDLLETAAGTSSGTVELALRLLVGLAWRVVDGADGASVSLRQWGRLSTVASSDTTVVEMDANQYATGEGPCIDASIVGHSVFTESLHTETRWPTFVPRARALGIDSILSSALLARGTPVGALNIYSRQASAFTPDARRMASRFAEEASVVLTDAGLDVSVDRRDPRLTQALRSREVISQAQGVLMERHTYGEDDAYAALRQGSVASGLPFRRTAAEVVASAQVGRSAELPRSGRPASSVTDHHA